MQRDFTLSKYKKLIEAITFTDYMTTTIHDYLQSTPDKCIIIRHDVDRAVNRALDMAQLEQEYGITSTFYFRYTNDVFHPGIIQEIADKGHEIGFHYEVLDKAKGDPLKAIKIFEKELNQFREIVNVTTICMHGNPFARWSNYDLWNRYNYNDFGIIGEPYLSIDYNKVLYLTDTGRTWADLKIRVKDVVKSIDRHNHISNKKISSTDDIIGLIQTENIPQICILAHPNRWCDNPGLWTKELILQNIKNLGKAGIIWYRTALSRTNII